MSIVNLTHLMDGLKYSHVTKSAVTDGISKTIGINSKNNNQVAEGDNINLSDVSKRLSKEIGSFRNKVQEETNRALSDKDINSMITEEYINEFIAAGKKVEKPSEDIDDLTWGMMVELGSKIGIDDPSILSELTVKDLEVFFYESNIKENAFQLSDKPLVDKNGTALKQYTSKQEFWNEIFIKDSNGNISRNANFSMSVLSSPDGKFSEIFFSQGSDKKLSELSTGSLHNFLLSFESQNTEMFKHAASTASYAEKNNNIDVLSVQKSLKDGYKNLQSFMKDSPTQEAQIQMLKNAMASGEWEQFFPYI